jgi:arginine deiminase
MAAIYKFHPSFARAEFEVWWGNPEENYRSATLKAATCSQSAMATY